MLGVLQRSFKARDQFALKSHTWRAGGTLSSPHYARPQSPLVEVNQTSPSTPEDTLLNLAPWRPQRLKDRTWPCLYR